MKQLGLGIIVAIGLTLPVFGQDVDPMIGTWKFNVAKSTWVGGPPIPQSMTMTYVADGPGLTGTLDIVGARGGKGTAKYTIIWDGQLHPVVGSPGGQVSREYDSTVYARFGDTINQIYYKDGKVVLVGSTFMDDNKNTFTGHFEGVAPNGQRTRRVLVWERQ
jgi:hypothetical protein